MSAFLHSVPSPQGCPIHDVIICGAGPVGLFLACELALAKCSVLILEKEENPNSPLKQLPFGIRGLSAPSASAFHHRGLLKEFELHKRLKNPHQNAKSGAQRQAGHFAGIPFLDGNIDSSQWKYCLSSSTEGSLISEMAEIETVLAGRAQALGVAIIRGHAVTSVEQTQDHVTVWSGEKSFESKWLVGCDGSRSVVRKAAGFDFAGTEPEFTGYSAQIDIADREKLKPGRNSTPTGMYFQSQPGYLVMVEFDGGSGHRESPLTLEKVQDVLRRVSHTDVTLSAFHAATSWTDRARQATTYIRGRVLLAGDAAHIHSPLGGQGLNLGLGDAMNLGWKLAATIHSKALDGLLESYETERFPLGAAVLDWSRAQVTIMKPNPSSRALHAVICDLINTRDGATYFAGRVWGIDIHYDLGGEHPLVGHVVPNFEFENGKTIGDLMHDGAGILIDFGQDDLLRSIAEKYGGQFRYLSCRAKEQLGLIAALIRPDGIIAWASDGNINHSLLEQAASRWFDGTGYVTSSSKSQLSI